MFKRFSPLRKLKNLVGKVRLITSPPVNVSLLNDLLSAQVVESPLPERINWMEQVLLWVFPPSGAKSDARIRMLVGTLEKNLLWKNHFQQMMNSLFRDCYFLPMATYVGVAVERGLWGDLSDRLRAKFILGGGTASFEQILLSVFREDSQVNALRELTPESLSQLTPLLCTPNNAAYWEQRQQEIEQARTILSIHAAHHGLSAPISRMLGSASKPSTANTFMQLSTASLSGDPEILEKALDGCGQDVQKVYAHMEERGVSVDVVNRLETMSALLSRIRLLSHLSFEQDSQRKAQYLKEFLADAIEAGRRGRSIWNYLTHHFYLLSRKIVERNGQSAEHYIARTDEESSLLFRSALGGGLIVVAMTYLKLSIVALKPAPLFLAIEISLIYSLGFLAMQFSGATLATKIPSFTASRLAKLLEGLRRKSSDVFQAEFRLILKSQSLALLGNVIGVLACVLVLDLLRRYLTGEHQWVSPKYAHHAIEDLNPFLSFAVILGMLTGLQLWLSSLAGGWFENWVVFNRVPEAIANHLRFRRLFGEATAMKLGQWVQKHASGLATNISLGCLFGFTPLLGALFRANWNGNHVTISTATALFASFSLDYSLSKTEVALTALGLVLIAMANFIVSFGLALYVAAMAQEANFGRTLYYLRKSLGFKVFK